MDIGGRIVGNLFASIDFPEPGGPIRMTLCPPEAAISKARLQFSCPLTSEKSIDDNRTDGFSVHLIRLTG